MKRSLLAFLLLAGAIHVWTSALLTKVLTSGDISTGSVSVTIGSGSNAALVWWGQASCIGTCTVRESHAATGVTPPTFDISANW